MNDLQFESWQWWEDIAERLRKMDVVDASADNSGGGIIVISIPFKSGMLVFGTANETWGADYYETIADYEGGNPQMGPETNLSSQETDTQTIAAALYKALTDFANVTERRYVERLRQFREAAIGLYKAWEQLDPQSKFHDWATESYPFKESFDETVSAINQWAHEIEQCVAADSLGMTKEQAAALCFVINNFGTGQHAVATGANLKFFKKEYIAECVNKALESQGITELLRGVLAAWKGENA